MIVSLDSRKAAIVASAHRYAVLRPNRCCSVLQELERRPSGQLPQSSTPLAEGDMAQRSAAVVAWGTLLSAFALVARHDPRPRVADTSAAALLVSAECPA